MSYAELQSFSAFSFLRGSSQPKELVERAHELGIRALAITDLNGVYGLPRAFQVARHLSGFKLISGAVLTIGLDLHFSEQSSGGGGAFFDKSLSQAQLQFVPRLTLLARNRLGYGLLCRLITASHAGKAKGSASLSIAEFLSLIQEQSSEACSGLILLPEIYCQPQALPLVDEARVGVLLSYLKQVQPFFEGRFFLPVHRYLDGHDQKREQWVRWLARCLGVPVVATQGVHFHRPGRKRLGDVMNCIRQGLPLDQAAGATFSNAERTLKSPRQMRTLFSDWPSVLDQTLEIAEGCTFSLQELRYRYPSEWIPPDQTAQGFLEERAWKGAEKRYPQGIPPSVRMQLQHELRLVEELQFSDYFLTIDEIVEFARSRGILCQGRGSAANSAICYCLGITAVDPVQMDLLFERFLSAERGEPPDIDVDFEHDRREEVIQHIYDKYGRDRAGMVSAVITYRGRSARREIAKVFSVPDEKSADFFKQNLAAQTLVEEIRGFPRHLSIHSGGFTLSADPLIETVPIEPARMVGRTIVQWDKEDLACIGLLKVDVLALGMLSALRRCMDLVNQDPGRMSRCSGLPAPKLELATIPADDPATYQMIQHADTVGTFQIESRAQMGMLGRLQPRNFYDLVIQVAIVRPGPIVGQMVHPYLKRRRGLEPAVSPHPKLEKILGRTLGVPLFQEQVMKIAIELAEFTPGEADELRRAIGAWRSSGTIEKMGIKLKQGLLKNQLPLEYVERIFAQVQGFAEYGFPESHAASFALLAYASAFLKCHYPAEFLVALLNSLPMGFYSAHTLIDDAKRHGVSVLPVSPQHSHWECQLEPVSGASVPAVRLGFCLVSGISKAKVEEMLRTRNERPFSSLADFMGRTAFSLQNLLEFARGDFFRIFGDEQRGAFWAVLGEFALRTSSRRQGVLQLNLFSEQPLQFLLASPARFELPERACFESLSELQMIQSDYRVLGCSTRGHPMAALRKLYPNLLPRVTARELKTLPSGRRIRAAGLVIVRQRPGTAKGTTFATLEDESGFLDLILHLSVFSKYQDIFLSQHLLLIEGMLQRDLHSASVLVRKVTQVDLTGDGSKSEGSSLDPLDGSRWHSRDFH